MNRRGFLKLMASAGLSAAALSIARSALAAESPARRVIFFYHPDGCNPSTWFPEKVAGGFNLPVSSAPLEAVRNHCVFLRYVRMYGPGDSHEAGVRKLLTGGSGNAGSVPMSLDYYLAQQFRSVTTKPLLALNIVPSWEGSHLTFDGNGVEVVPEPNPLAAYESLFGGTGGQNAGRISMVDRSLTELNRLRSKLGATESAKLDAHAESLSELRGRLATAGGACDPSWVFNPGGVFKVTRTHYWDTPEYRDARQMELIGELQMDVALHAIKCGLTRVVTLQWSHCVNDAKLPGLEQYGTCHDASHTQGNAFAQVKAWYSRQLAKLITNLANTPEGSGTLLDNTLIFVCSELGNGSWHDHEQMPFVIAGGHAAGITGNRFLECGSESNKAPHSKILVSIAQFMGMNINSYGPQMPNSGPLEGLVG